ncbi:MAG: HAD-IA family hydrolase [Macellibacteroides fermentans]
MIQRAIQSYLYRHSYPILNPKAVLFDMDGVLYDSMRYHARAWSETSSLHQLISTPEDFYMFEGRTGESTINILFQRTFGRDATEEEKAQMYKQKSELFNHYNDGATMDGATEVISNVKRHGLQTLVVTGSGQESLLSKLNQSFPNCFEREKMVTAYDVEYGKPHPEPYLIGLNKAGVQPWEAFVVENAPMGVEASVAAGIFTIAVNTGPLPDSVLLGAGADILFPSMADLAAAWDDIMKACR